MYFSIDSNHPTQSPSCLSLYGWLFVSFYITQLTPAFAQSTRPHPAPPPTKPSLKRKPSLPKRKRITRSNVSNETIVVT
ncbi:MAG: hypothetical protein AAGJ35_06105, partial [Myxococcota bacterium]